MDFEGVMKLLLKPKQQASTGENTSGGAGAQGRGGAEGAEPAESSAETVPASPSFLSKFGIGSKSNSSGNESGNGKSKSPGGWRGHLDAETSAELNKLVRGTRRHRRAYMKTLMVRDAQLWVALTQVSKRLNELENYISNQSQTSVTGAQGHRGTDTTANGQQPTAVLPQPKIETNIQGQPAGTQNLPIVIQKNQKMLISGQFASSSR